MKTILYEPSKQNGIRRNKWTLKVQETQVKKKKVLNRWKKKMTSMVTDSWLQQIVDYTLSLTDVNNSSGEEEEGQDSGVFKSPTNIYDGAFRKNS